MSTESVYLVVRGDLPAGLQLAQAAHAAIAWAVRRLTGDHGELWGADAANRRLVALSAPDEPSLEAVLAALGDAAVGFYEPDLGGQLTAVATSLGAPLGSLPLALRQAAAAKS